ncbi:uncharacterized protein GBIM_07102 [Gryllus bimaculatus]|nr:uncharacterized protein GBIM_07102 [Gryllus bimaculatus]
MTNPEATGDLPRVLRGDAVGDTMYSERWILKQLIRITKYIAGEEEFNDDFELDLCTLWDMCADKEVIAFTRKHGLIALAINAIMKSQSPRLSEIMVGIIGNMCTSKNVREECKQRTDVIRVMMELLAFPDSPTLIQVMRVLQTFAWEVSNSSQSPHGRRNEDGDQIDNDHNEADHNNDYENDYDYDPLHMHDEFYEERDIVQNANDTRNPSHKSESDSSEESSLSDMEVAHTLPTSSNKSGEELKFSTEDKSVENLTEVDQDRVGDSEGTGKSANITIQSQESANENKNQNIASSSTEVKTANVDEVEEMIISCGPQSTDASAEEMIISCVPQTADVSTEERSEPGIGTSADEDPSGVAGPSASVASTSGMGKEACPESSEDGTSCSSGPGGTSGGRRCAGYAWRNIDDNDYEDDDAGDDENPEVVAVSVNDDSVIIGTAFLWYEQFLKVENWLPEIVYILNSSKNAELIGLTWTLLSILCYIRVGDSYLCCNISGPDVMRGLLESFKEFFGQYADLDNSAFHDVLKCRKGVFKAVIMKNIFQMLTFFNHFLPVDGDLHEYLIHSYTILDHVLMSEPYEMSSFRAGINGILQLLDDLTEEKKKQDGNNVYPRYAEDAIDTTERYLMNVLLWLNRMHSADRLGEFEDVRNKLIAKFG